VLFSSAVLCRRRRGGGRSWGSGSGCKPQQVGAEALGVSSWAGLAQQLRYRGRGQGQGIRSVEAARGVRRFPSRAHNYCSRTIPGRGG